MADDDALFRKGMPIRREVLGPDYVDAAMARADEFMMSFQRATTAWAWGWAWGDPTVRLPAFTPGSSGPTTFASASSRPCWGSGTAPSAGSSP